MIAVLARLWIFALMAIAIIYALTGFALLTIDPKVVAILWLVLFFSLLVYLIQTTRQPTA